jgi:hypothetical protein
MQRTMCLLLPNAAIDAVCVEIAYNRALVDGIEAAAAVIAAVLRKRNTGNQGKQTHSKQHVNSSHARDCQSFEKKEH